MNIFSNEVLLANMGNIFYAMLVGFLLSFFLTPIAGLLAKMMGAVDKPANMRNITDRTNDTRLHSVPIPRWGGLAVLFAFLIGLILIDKENVLSPGIITGFLIISVFALLDDKYELPGKVMIIGQLLAGFALVFGGDSIKEISLFGFEIGFDWFVYTINIPEIFGFGPYVYNLTLVADIVTLLWIVGIMNAVNWMSAIDGLNLSVSSIFATTIMFIVLGQSNPNVALAIVIALYVGSLLGVLPYNWNPAKIFPGAAEYMSGYMLGVFGILGSTRWSATLIILALPILDAIFVVLRRFKEHPQVRKNIFAVLSVSDRNHLHHKLLDAGFSRKNTLFLYISFALMFSILGLFVQGDIRSDFLFLICTFALFFLIFTIFSYLQNRNKKIQQNSNMSNRFRPNVEKAEVRVVIGKKVEKTEEEEDYQKFVY